MRHFFPSWILMHFCVVHIALHKKQPFSCIIFHCHHGSSRHSFGWTFLAFNLRFSWFNKDLAGKMMQTQFPHRSTISISRQHFIRAVRVGIIGEPQTVCHVFECNYLIRVFATQKMLQIQTESFDCHPSIQIYRIIYCCPNLISLIYTMMTLCVTGKQQLLYSLGGTY